MATIKQYQSGEAAKMVRLAYEQMKSLDEPLPESKTGKLFQAHISDLEPLAINMEQAFQFIKSANKCAIGDRLCACEFTDAPETAAIFLDKLSDAMVKAGKAKYCSKEEAKSGLLKYKENPLIISKVSGNYAEICRTFPTYCFYWNMERHGMKCLKRLRTEHIEI